MTAHLGDDLLQSPLADAVPESTIGKQAHVGSLDAAHEALYGFHFDNDIHSPQSGL